MDTVRLGLFFAVGAFFGGIAFASLFAYLPAEAFPPLRIGSVLLVCAYTAGVALFVSVPFALALQWLRAAGRIVSSDMSSGALLFGAAFGSPMAVLTYPPVIQPSLFAALIIAALVSALAAFFLTAQARAPDVDDG